jgi:purine-binding chemotaxis protein CheW
MVNRAPVLHDGGDTAPADHDEQVVLCELAGELYGVEIAWVEEIIRLPAITPVPRARFAVQGVINLRGTIMPVVDPRLVLDLPCAAPTRNSRVIVVQVGGHTIGLIVDAVTEVRRVPAAAIEPPAALGGDLDTTHLRGIAKLDGRLAMLLDLASALAVGR